MSALPRQTVAYLQPRPPSHATLREMIRHGHDIDLEEMSSYLSTLLLKMTPSSHPQSEVVRDYLDKVIDGIDDCLAIEREQA